MLCVLIIPLIARSLIGLDSRWGVQPRHARKMDEVQSAADEKIFPTIVRTTERYPAVGIDAIRQCLRE